MVVYLTLLEISWKSDLAKVKGDLDFQKVLANVPQKSWSELPWNKGNDHLINQLLTTVIKSGKLTVSPPEGFMPGLVDLSIYLQKGQVERWQFIDTKLLTITEVENSCKGILYRTDWPDKATREFQSQMQNKNTVWTYLMGSELATAKKKHYWLSFWNWLQVLFSELLHLDLYEQ